MLPEPHRSQARDDVVRTGRTPAAPRTVKRADGLGWFSLVLGAAQLIMPGVVGRVTGVGDSPRQRVAMRLIGARELASGVGILTSSKPSNWLWARVAGDALDLVLLGRALTDPGANKNRVMTSIVSVAGVAAADLQTAANLSRAGPKQRRVVRTISVRGAVEDVRRRWEASDVRPRDVEVRFVPMHGGTLTGIFAELTHGGSSGALSSVVVKAAGKRSAADVDRALRAFKQVIETGGVMR